MFPSSCWFRCRMTWQLGAPPRWRQPSHTRACDLHRLACDVFATRVTADSIAVTVASPPQWESPPSPPPLFPRLIFPTAAPEVTAWFKFSPLLLQGFASRRLGHLLSGHCFTPLTVVASGVGGEGNLAVEIRTRALSLAEMVRPEVLRASGCRTDDSRTSI
jgi:hypothetical protein